MMKLNLFVYFFGSCFFFIYRYFMFCSLFLVSFFLVLLIENWFMLMVVILECGYSFVIFLECFLNLYFMLSIINLFFVDNYSNRVGFKKDRL